MGMHPFIAGELSRQMVAERLAFAASQRRGRGVAARRRVRRRLFTRVRQTERRVGASPDVTRTLPLGPAGTC
jgi:hypothetical protein